MLSEVVAQVSETPREDSSYGKGVAVEVDVDCPECRVVRHQQRGRVAHGRAILAVHLDHPPCEHLRRIQFFLAEDVRTVSAVDLLADCVDAALPQSNAGNADLAVTS